ncbi:synaptic plasticity regulator PANTS isoform X2 [Caloenas nicobarica]|uniref:synaptic plasticity regulator PANTS isoform X2 n=1 Tax=Caloenas nicobarica TaxID=187106 RepID=UPI0032B73A81
MAGGESWRPPRSCEDYWWEWKHCRGLRHAFHHYYTHGELPACGRWREDYEACRAWERGRAAAAQVPPGPAGKTCSWGVQERSWLQPHKAERQEPFSAGCSITRPFSRLGCLLGGKEALCKSERARVMEKQKYAPVWKLRKSPPPDWYLPLDEDKPN